MNWFNYQTMLINEINNLLEDKEYKEFVKHEVSNLQKELQNLQNDYINTVSKMDNNTKDKWTLHLPHNTIYYSSNRGISLEISRMEGIRITIENNLKRIYEFLKN